MFKWNAKKVGIAAAVLLVAGDLAGCGASGNQLTVSSFGSQTQ